MNSIENGINKTSLECIRHGLAIFFARKWKVVNMIIWLLILLFLSNQINEIEFKKYNISLSSQNF